MTDAGKGAPLSGVEGSGHRFPALEFIIPMTIGITKGRSRWFFILSRME